MSGQLVFGDFRLDCLNDTLLNGGETISLTPKAFSLLRYLAESGGRLLRKDELLETVWPGLVVGDAALNVCISEIRKALGDQAGAPRYIQTVHKRGYRFIASLEEAAPHDKPKTVEETVSLQGRDEIFERLTTAYDRANQGRRQLIFLNGEPGIGKTSVVEAFSARLRRSREV
jgi:DNA-binding winged helix-turn-helix (wHTH) protein